MTARRDTGQGVTYIGDAPLSDRDGYVVDVGTDQHHHVLVKAALDGAGVRAIRADLDIPEAEALSARLIEAIHEAKEQQ